MKLAPPPGFSVSGGAEIFIARGEQRDELEAAGLTRSAVWNEQLARSPHRAGRGSTARLRIGTASVLRLKQMRRGGLLEPLWCDRFPGTDRLLQNLRIPLEALSRGVATANPVAMLLVPGPPGLYRAWIAFDELDGAIDLTTAVRSETPPGADELRIAMDVVRRMHDAGIEHRDLNLGNLMIRRVEQRTEAFVIDLDRARVASGPLRFGERQRSLRRLERSWVKETGREDGADWIYAGYAGSDAVLRARLEKGRRTGRRLTRLHRQGGRR